MVDAVVETADDVSQSFTDYRARAEQARTLDQMRRYREQQGLFNQGPVAQEVRRVTRGMESFAGATADTAATVLRNVSDIPLQIPAGVIDGVREVFRAGDDIADVLGRLTGAELPADRAANLANRPGHVVADMIPNPLPDASTPTGAFVRQAAQFFYGFTRGQRVLSGLNLGRTVTALGAGAIADAFFRDPHDQRLANLWQAAGLPQNAVTDWLASNPADDAAEGRLKAAAEGVLTGAALQLFMSIARGARAAYRAHAMAASEGGADEATRLLEQARQQFGEMDPNRINALLGDQAGPVGPTFRPAPGAAAGAGADDATLRMTGRLRTAAEAVAQDTEGGAGGIAAQLAGAGSSARPGPRATFINFSRINTPDDVQAVLRDMAEAYAPSIREAARGEVSNEQTAALASQMGLSVESLLGRARGPMSAQEALAARQLLNQSASRLMDLAGRAADANATPAELFAFRRMMAVHAAIQTEVLAARTETARALQSWAIPAGTGGVEAARAVQQALEGAGGAPTQQAIARRLAMLAQAGADPGTIAAFTRVAGSGGTVAAIQEAWINGLLSSPITHMRNITSNTLAAVNQVWERALAQRIDAALGRSSIAPDEDVAMIYGAVTGFGDSLRLAGRVLREGNGGPVAQMLNRVDLPHAGAISSEALGLSPTSGLGRAVDLVGQLVRIPGRALGVEDAFFKSINFRMELHATALRQAAQELGADGMPLRGPALWQRVMEIVANPPEAVRMAAADSALYATFNNQGGPMISSLLQFRNNWPLATIALPFVRTPGNVLRYTFERTPLAPLVGQWRADVAAGGSRQALALARLASGTAILAAGFNLADRYWTADPEGNPMPFEISGRGPDPGREQGRRDALLRQGWQPYSVRIGDRWYGYNSIDPLGFLLGFSADVRDLVRRREIAPEQVDDVHELIAQAATTISASVVSRTWMQGLTNLVEALDRPGEGKLEQYLSRLAGSLVPAGVAAAERAANPVQSEPGSPYEAILARIPGLATQVPVRRDLWGREVATGSGLGPTVDLVSPFPGRQVVESPVDRELQRLNANIDPIPRSGWGGADVNLRDWPEVYDAYRRLAGNELRHPAWGLGLHDFLDAVVSGRHDLSEVYRQLTDGRDGGRAQFIRNAVQEYRQLARQAIEADPQFSAFAEFVRGRQEQRREQRIPIRLN